MIAALKRWALPIMGLIVPALGTLALHEHDARVRASAEVTRLSHVVATLETKEAQVQVAFRPETVLQRRTRTVYDTARVTDTVMRHDTVFVRRDVADSAVNSCTLALRTCEQGWALARARGDTLAALNAAIKKAQPSKFWTAVKWAGIGVAGGIIYSKVRP